MLLPFLEPRSFAARPVRKANKMASPEFSKNGQMLSRTRANGSAAKPEILHQVASQEDPAAYVSQSQQVEPTLATQIGATPSGVEMLNSAQLAERLGVPESWVRSRSNPKRANDPIPHYKFGRYVQFPWGRRRVADLAQSPTGEHEQGRSFQGEMNDPTCFIPKRLFVPRSRGLVRAVSPCGAASRRFGEDAADGVDAKGE